MGGRKRIVDIEIAVGGEGAGKGRIIGLFAWVKPQVLEQQDLAFVQR